MKKTCNVCAREKAPLVRCKGKCKNELCRHVPSVKGVCLACLTPVIKFPHVAEPTP